MYTHIKNYITMQQETAKPIFYFTATLRGPNSGQTVEFAARQGDNLTTKAWEEIERNGRYRYMSDHNISVNEKQLYGEKWEIISIDFIDPSMRPCTPEQAKSETIPPTARTGEMLRRRIEKLEDDFARILRERKF